jgi:glycosyltransferase involved in cell wall biosynthesis
MRIAQLAPLVDTVAPRGVSPVQQLIHHLVEALIERGHDVTLFASGESQTTARLHALPCIARGSSYRMQYAAKVLQLEYGLFSEESFDVIHSHLDCLALPFARRALSPVLTTVYDPCDTSSTAELYAEFNDLPLVSHSVRQRSIVPTARWVGTIYPGLPEHAFQFRPNPGDYLAYLGPLSPETLHSSLLSLTHDTGIPLRIAGPWPAYNRSYSEQLNMRLQCHNVEYMGEIDEAEEDEFLGRALAVILSEAPTTLSGVTTIKALACGTPVVTVASHPDAELIEDGITGFTCVHHDDMAFAVERVARLDRRDCRDAFEANFTLNRMVDEYLKVYKTVRDQHSLLRLR